MKFSHIEPYMPDFLEDYPGSVSIPTITAGWEKPSGNGLFSGTQSPLNLSWAFSIQKIQGKTLERLVFDLGAGEKCSGIMLVALSRVRMFKHLLLKPLAFEQLRKVDTSSGLVDIKNTLATLEKSPLLQDFSIQPYFKTNASFLSPSFTDRIFIYLSDSP